MLACTHGLISVQLRSIGTRKSPRNYGIGMAIIVSFMAGTCRKKWMAASSLVREKKQKTAIGGRSSPSLPSLAPFAGGLRRRNRSCWHPIHLVCASLGTPGRLVLRHLDIVCPFGFGRMPSGDLTGQQAAAVWQAMCNKAGSHLWMDMETFVFQGTALIPGPIGGIIQSLRHGTSFEKIICYEYSGIFNSQGSTMKPGGPPTVILYRDYQRISRV